MFLCESGCDGENVLRWDGTCMGSCMCHCFYASAIIVGSVHMVTCELV